MKRSVRVLLVENHSPIRDFLSNFIREIPGMEVVGEASNGLEGLQIAQDLRPDLILMDVALPELNGIETARQIRKVSPDSKILMMGVHYSSDIVKEALRSGANGYLVTSDAVSQLGIAVEWVLLDRVFISSSVEKDDLDELLDT